jgi:hypothetical protein
MSAEPRPRPEPAATAEPTPPPPPTPAQPPGEVDGPSGPEPTRYGDWEKNGRCSDF